MQPDLAELVGAAVRELIDNAWSAVIRVAEQSVASEVETLHLFKRETIAALRAMKPAHGVDYADDGRTALWRVRTMLWESDSLIADSDPDAPFQPETVGEGATVIAGLAGVAREVRGLVTAHHATADPGWAVVGLGEGVLLAKIRSLRVALSNQDGSCVWRLRYTLEPPAAPTEPAPHDPRSLRGLVRTTGPRYLRADVRISRAAPARR